jgi:hypothetical protein
MSDNTTTQETDEDAAQYAAVWRAIRELGIKVIEVQFSGSGDSGEIEDIRPAWIFGGTEDENMKRAENFRRKVVSFSDYVPPTHSLESLIRDLSNDILNQPEIPDWYNNEGGNGTMEWIAEDDGTNHIELTVNVAVVEYETSTFSYRADGTEIEE